MCSIFGVVATKLVDPAELVTYANILAADTQHRGDSWIGIAYSDGTFLRTEKRPGWITSIFGDQVLVKKIIDRTPQMLFGQTRFPTCGDSTKINAQPYYLRLPQGMLTLASNGDLFDYEAERARQQSLGIKHITTNDAEVQLSEIWLSSHDGEMRYHHGIAQLMRTVPASFASWLATEDGVDIFRDTFGNRPLYYMVVGSYFIFASEDCALLGVLMQRAEEGHRDGVVDIYQVLPGEVVHVPLHGQYQRQQLVPARQRLAMCPFERIYLSRPDSNVFGCDNFTNPLYYKVMVRGEDGEVFFDPIGAEGIEDVASFRYRLGQQLALEHPAPEAQCVIDIPESGTDGAIGYASASGLTYRRGLVRNPYIARTFISPGRDTRVSMARIKYRPKRSLFRKMHRVVVVDDSVVFGTSSARVDQLIRSTGALIDKRVTCPPIKFPCRYGVDMTSKGKLIASEMEVESMRQAFHLASLGFLSLEGLREVLGSLAGDSCFACLNGEYPITPEIMASIS